MNVYASICCALITTFLGIVGNCIADEPKDFTPELPAKTGIAYIDHLLPDPVIFKLASEVDTNSTKAKAPIVNFYVYTAQNQTTPDLFSLDRARFRKQLQNSSFDAIRTTIFVTHGWMDNGTGEMCTRLRDAYLQYEDINVVIVDWKGDTFLTYKSAMKQVKAVGQEIAKMLALLVIHAHLQLNWTILVGHSVGAHMMGIAGKAVEGKVNTIFGLDPSLQGFQVIDNDERLSRLSAQYVQVLHTNAARLGLNEAIGSADFYANDGVNQPGCQHDNVCSHNRAWEYFAESLERDWVFFGAQCSSSKNLARAHLYNNEVSYTCDHEIRRRMGGIEADREAQGIFLFETATQAPFALGENRRDFKHIVR